MTESTPQESLPETVVDPFAPPETKSPNPFEAPLHAITADAKRDSFTQRWAILTAGVGTLSRAVAWGLILYISLDYMPSALEKLSDKSVTVSRGTLAAIAWLDRMAVHKTSLWICWAVMLAFDFYIRFSDLKRTPWRLWAWNFFTFWIPVPLCFVFFIVLMMKLA